MFSLIQKLVIRQDTKPWKKSWWNATWGGEEGVGARKIKVDDDDAQRIIDSFGDRLITFARPVWKIQADPLKKTDFVR